MRAYTAKGPGPFSDDVMLTTSPGIVYDLIVLVVHSPCKAISADSFFNLIFVFIRSGCVILQQSQCV